METSSRHEYAHECTTLDQVLAWREFVRIIGGDNGLAHATADGYVTWASLPTEPAYLPGRA